MRYCYNTQRGELMKTQSDTKVKGHLPKEKDKPSPEAVAKFCRIVAQQLANSKHGCGM